MTEGKVTQWQLNTGYKDGPSDLGGGPGAFYANRYPRLTLGTGNAPGSYGEYGELAGQMRFVERTSPEARPFHVLRHGALAGRHRGPRRLPEKDWKLSRVFAMAAAVVYAQTAIREHPERADETREMAEAFCDQARLRAERRFHELWTNADEPNHRLALHVLKGRHTWLEAGIMDASFGDGPMVPSIESDKGIPAFGKSLYLGDFQRELISPQPELPAEVVEKGERFLAALRAFLEDNVDPQAIEREGRISDEVVAGLKAVGALGMKVPEQYGGLGLSQVYYNRAMMLAGTCHSSVSTRSNPTPTPPAAGLRGERSTGRAAYAR